MGELTPDRWGEFRREYDLKRGRVEDISDAEEHRLLVSLLPLRWQKEILREEEKRRKNRHLVKITNAPQKPQYIFRGELEAWLHEEVEKVRPIQGGYLVVCGSAQIQEKIMRLEGWLLDGKQVHVTRAQERMTGPEIFELIGSKLETEAALQTLNPSSNVHVHQVGAAPNSPKGEKARSNNSPRKWENVQTTRSGYKGGAKEKCLLECPEKNLVVRLEEGDEQGKETPGMGSVIPVQRGD